MKRIMLSVFVMFFIAVIAGCGKDSSTAPSGPDYISLELGTAGNQCTLSTDDAVWYSVDCGGATTMQIVWEDSESSDEAGLADILVSVYQMDAATPYKIISNNKDFVDKTNSTFDNPKQISLDKGESTILIKIMGDPLTTSGVIPGDFTIRVTDVSDIDPETISLGVWHEDSLAEGETDWFEVSSGTASTLTVMWKELESPEGTGYTGDIIGSVYYADAATPYIIVDNNKEFENKDKSHTDNPKSINVENNAVVLIKIALNPDHIGGPQAGSYAVCVVDAAL